MTINNQNPYQAQPSSEGLRVLCTDIEEGERKFNPFSTESMKTIRAKRETGTAGKAPGCSPDVCLKPKRIPVTNEQVQDALDDLYRHDYSDPEYLVDTIKNAINDFWKEIRKESIVFVKGYISFKRFLVRNFRTAQKAAA